MAKYNWIAPTTVQKIIDWVKEKFVQKEVGKQLTSNDFTNTLKAKVDAIPDNPSYTDTTYTNATEVKDGLMPKESVVKLKGIANGANVNTIEKVKRNGMILTVTNKEVDVLVPTKTSELTNDSQYVKQSVIPSLVAEYGRMKKQIVESLPDVAGADDNTIYLVPKTDNVEQDGYSEFLKINGKWEKMGDTGVVDLTGYLKESDMIEITATEVDTWINA